MHDIARMAMPAVLVCMLEYDRLRCSEQKVISPTRKSVQVVISMKTPRCVCHAVWCETQCGTLER
jgi:hypothetical protein